MPNLKMRAYFRYLAPQGWCDIDRSRWHFVWKSRPHDHFCMPKCLPDQRRVCVWDLIKFKILSNFRFLAPIKVTFEVEEPTTNFTIWEKLITSEGILHYYMSIHTEYSGRIGSTVSVSSIQSVAFAQHVKSISPKAFQYSDRHRHPNGYLINRS